MNINVHLKTIGRLIAINPNFILDIYNKSKFIKNRGLRNIASFTKKVFKPQSKKFILRLDSYYKFKCLD